MTSHPVRRGATGPAVLWTVLALGTLATTAVVFTPRVLRATGGGAVFETTAARVPRHQQVADLLGQIIGRSREVLAVHRRDPGPYAELVLWHDGAHESDEIELNDITVISHSRVMQTLTMYSLETVPDDESPLRTVTRDHAGKAAFCQVWRDRGDVTARVLATGLADFDAEPTVFPDGRPGPLRIFFTWAPDSSDGPDEASILVDVAMSQEMES